MTPDTTAMTPDGTWAGVLLSGLAGSLIGGMVTVAVLLITLRAERSVVAQQLQAAAAAARHDRLDQAVTGLASRASRMVSHVARGDFRSTATQDAFMELLEAAGLVITRARPDAPAFATTIETLASDIAKDVAKLATSPTKLGTGATREQVQKDLMALRGAAGRWHVAPDDFQAGKADAEIMRKLAADGGAVAAGWHG